LRCGCCMGSGRSGRRNALFGSSAHGCAPGSAEVVRRCLAEARTSATPRGCTGRDFRSVAPVKSSVACRAYPCVRSVCLLRQRHSPGSCLQHALPVHIRSHPSTPYLRAGVERAVVQTWEDRGDAHVGRQRQGGALRRRPRRAAGKAQGQRVVDRGAQGHGWQGRWQARCCAGPGCRGGEGVAGRGGCRTLCCHEAGVKLRRPCARGVPPRHRNGMFRQVPASRQNAKSRLAAAHERPAGNVGGAGERGMPTGPLTEPAGEEPLTAHHPDQHTFLLIANTTSLLLSWTHSIPLKTPL